MAAEYRHGESPISPDDWGVDEPLWKSLNLPPPEDLEGGPPVDDDDLEAFCSGYDLAAEERTRIALNIGRYRAWREEFSRVLRKHYPPKPTDSK